VAISDLGGSLAWPLEVVPSHRLTRYLGTLLAEEGIWEVLVGVPKTLGGEVGLQAGRALDMIGALREEFPLVRFVEWDERLSTRVARSSSGTGQSGARRGGRSGRRKGGGRQRVDHLAAAAMLQEYLDRRGPLEATR
jgi:putative holliday junction resolvase